MRRPEPPSFPNPFWPRLPVFRLPGGEGLVVTPANLTILGAEAGDWLALVSSQQYDSLSRARVGGGAGHRRGMGHNLSTHRL